MKFSQSPGKKPLPPDKIPFDPKLFTDATPPTSNKQHPLKKYQHRCPFCGQRYRLGNDLTQHCQARHVGESLNRTRWFEGQNGVTNSVTDCLTLQAGSDVKRKPVAQQQLEVVDISEDEEQDVTASTDNRQSQVSASEKDSSNMIHSVQMFPQENQSKNPQPETSMEMLATNIQTNDGLLCSVSGQNSVQTMCLNNGSTATPATLPKVNSSYNQTDECRTPGGTETFQAAPSGTTMPDNHPTLPIAIAVYLTNTTVDISAVRSQAGIPNVDWIPCALSDYTYDPLPTDMQILKGMQALDSSTCPFRSCTQLFESVGEAAEHLAINHSNSKPYQCKRKRCNFRANSYLYLCKHIVHVHGITGQDRTAFPFLNPGKPASGTPDYRSNPRPTTVSPAHPLPSMDPVIFVNSLSAASTGVCIPGNLINGKTLNSGGIALPNISYPMPLNSLPTRIIGVSAITTNNVSQQNLLEKTDNLTSQNLDIANSLSPKIPEAGDVLSHQNALPETLSADASLPKTLPQLLLEVDNAAPPKVVDGPAGASSQIAYTASSSIGTTSSSSSPARRSTLPHSVSSQNRPSHRMMPYASNGCSLKQRRDTSWGDLMKARIAGMKAAQRSFTTAKSSPQQQQQRMMGIRTAAGQQGAEFNSHHPHGDRIYNQGAPLTQPYGSNNMETHVMVTSSGPQATVTPLSNNRGPPPLKARPFQEHDFTESVNLKECSSPDEQLADRLSPAKTPPPPLCSSPHLIDPVDSTTLTTTTTSKEDKTHDDNETKVVSVKDDEVSKQKVVLVDNDGRLSSVHLVSSSEEQNNNDNVHGTSTKTDPKANKSIRRIDSIVDKVANRCFSYDELGLGSEGGSTDVQMQNCVLVDNVGRLTDVKVVSEEYEEALCSRNKKSL